MASEVDPPHSQHVVCAVGAKLDVERLADVVERVGGPGFRLDREYTQDEPDPRMPQAFEVSADRVVPSFTERDAAAVAEHRAVAYVLGPQATAEEAFEASGRMLAVIGALLREGADAVKSESSGIAHGRDRWLTLADAAAGGAGAHERQAPALYSAFVRRPLSSGLMYYSCGLHLLGECDVEITAADDDLGLEWMDGLGRYLLVDRDSREIQDGDTFGLAAESSSRVLRHRECTRYRQDDLFYNPWGYWRLLAL